MMRSIAQILSDELSVDIKRIENVITLIEQGNTIPFIARYRKELHGGMDDGTLRTLESRLDYLKNLEKRRDEIRHAIEKQDKMTDALVEELEHALTLSELEDIYRPYKQNKRTRASIAKEKGLEPLSAIILAQDRPEDKIKEAAAGFVRPENGVDSIEDALSGALDIIAETIANNPSTRKQMKEAMIRMGTFESTAATKEDSVYRDYYAFSQPVHKLRGHQILAVNRGEKESILKTSLSIDARISLAIIFRSYIHANSPCRSLLVKAAEDSYSRLIFPSLKRELRSMLTDAANDGAIKNFATNLKALLMQPPVKGSVTLGFDPGYRNGCKLAVVDATGKVLDTAVIYPTEPFKRTEESERILDKLIMKYHIKNIAIGNGTASRESETFVAAVIRKYPEVSYAIVNESGASVYSASHLAAEEFPDYDVNLRSAVSIARRLQDPLAELVKIEPKAIGVGQYQHDMPQAKLSKTLSDVVEDCVNRVGANLNTASVSLLSYISGLTKTTAGNIVAYREANGKFHSRRELLKVSGLGPKTWEQCAGFLKIPESDHILDNTGVHPESYAAAEKLLSLCGFSLKDTASRHLTDLEERIARYGAEQLAHECGIGIPTLNDIVTELLKPGRDLRDELPEPILQKDVLRISDLKPGMILKGTVRNVIDFGAFVDIGIHQDGLVHISEICDRFIKHPSEILSVGDIVDVKVLDTDENRHRISLSIKQV